MASYIEASDKRHLYEERYWKLLLHMNEDGVSEIDDPGFFIAPDGKYDAKAELEATIKALVDEVRFDDNATACRYPARKAWIVEQLQIEQLPEVVCKEYDELMHRVDPQSVTLVFPYAHINSPASMFGHTFLRIDSSYASKLLSHAVNYTAQADQHQENGVIFAIKGLIGGYPGHYSLLPYYEKLKEYRDTERRDVWEYDLNLTQDEVKRMMQHVWELKDTYAWYYFFDENCSYNILWLIEAARPSVHLREYYFYQVLPPETVHAVEAEHLVKAKHYRPSKRSRLLAYEAVLSNEGHQMALELADSDAKPETVLSNEHVNLQEKRYVLEAASELAEYRYINRDLNKTQYLGRFHGILSARAVLGKGDDIEILEPPNPDEGHRANRLHMQSGWRNGTPIQMVGIRPAFHSIDESDIGYLNGTQIEFMSVMASYSDERIKMEEVTVVSLVSLAKRTAFIQPISWRMKVGWDRRSLSEKSRFIATVGAGGTWGNDDAYIYATVDPLIYLQGNATAALGVSAGGVLYGGMRHQTHLEVSRRFYEGGIQQATVHMTHNVRLYQNYSAGIFFDYIDKQVEAWRQGGVYLKVYF